MAASIFRKALCNFTTANARKGIKKALVPMLFVQNMSQTSNPTQVVTKNLQLHLCKDGQKQDEGRPLAVIFSWMMAKKKHVMKFGDFYNMQGFDVLTVDVTPLQLLWPVKGTQVVAEDVLKFLDQRRHYSSVLVHGFSVGGYVYGEVLVKIKKELDKYGPLCDRIVGQIFDSAVDYDGIPRGLPRAVTNNPILRKSLEAYVRYHMKTFYNPATQHYLRSSDQFHNNFVRAPGLFLFSRDDPVGTPEGNMRVIKRWEEMGIKVYLKCWESSPHVSHMHIHPDEYLEELAAFLDRIDLLRVPLEKLKRAKL